MSYTSMICLIELELQYVTTRLSTIKTFFYHTSFHYDNYFACSLGLHFLFQGKERVEEGKNKLLFIVGLLETFFISLSG